MSMTRLRMVGQFLRILMAQKLANQELERVPEPGAATPEGEQVLQYNRAMASKLVLPYVSGLELISLARADGSRDTALDLACGPGHFTLCLARYLDYRSVTGMDISPGMIQAARRNAVTEELSERATFTMGDATRIDHLGDRTVDLTCFTHAAHHMPTLDAVGQVVREMDRVTRLDGLVVLLDLTRLRTVKLTDRFVQAVAADYAREGLSQLYRDFHNSMHASWTVKELREAIPRDSVRPWYHIVPRGLPMLQVILGLPADGTKPFIRRSIPRLSCKGLVPDSMVAELNLLRWSLRLGSWAFFPAGLRNGACP
jgi:ubiquinone/menaquinone biosynthesis C-methylase UbiE